MKYVHLLLLQMIFQNNFYIPQSFPLELQDQMLLINDALADLKC